MFEKDSIKKISQNRKDWEKQTLHKNLEKFPERKEQFKSGSGEDVERLYTPEQIQETNYETEIGFPGQFPFTRSVQPSAYRGRFWTMRQYAGFGTAAESNKRYKYLLQQGTTGLSVAFDLCTQIGYDSDHPMSSGEVGKVGVAIDSLADMEILFAGIPLDKVSTSMTINAPAAILLAMYIAVAEKQGVQRNQLSGTIQNDILKEYFARGTYIFPPKPSMRLITDTFEFCAKEVPKWNAISISGYHIREAGSTAAQEVGFTLADAIAYVEAGLAAGLEIDTFAPRLSFFFNAHNDLLEEVAKFRAARRLWAKIMKDRFKAKNPRSMMLRFHTQTGGSTLTAQQPDNNIVRVAVQTLAAVLGGTQSLHTNGKDEALGLPTEESARIALRTQQIVAHESGVTETVDPLAGSYYIESLTNKIEKKALEYISKIDNIGGMITAIEIGFVQNEIQKSAYNYQREIENNDRIVVGLNKFEVAQEAKQDILKVDLSTQENQIKQLQKLKSNRDQSKVDNLLSDIKTMAEGEANLMYPILEAVKNYATLGEICDTLREVFGEYREQIVM
jgi:methylmalonyl-CoA mutase, N-terminal domain